LRLPSIQPDQHEPVQYRILLISVHAHMHTHTQACTSSAAWALSFPWLWPTYSAACLAVRLYHMACAPLPCAPVARCFPTPTCAMLGCSSGTKATRCAASVLPIAKPASSYQATSQPAGTRPLHRLAMHQANACQLPAALVCALACPLPGSPLPRQCIARLARASSMGLKARHACPGGWGQSPQRGQAHLVCN